MFSKLEFCFVGALAVLVVQVTAGCVERPPAIRDAEDYCWSNNVEMGKKLHDPKEEKSVTEPQKCEYYYCVFQELKLLNPQFDVPCMNRTADWLEKNVEHDQAVKLLERLKMCTGELVSVIRSSAGYYFYADNVDKNEGDKLLENPGVMQTKCDVSKEYMKCLAVAGKDDVSIRARAHVYQNVVKVSCQLTSSN